MTDDCLLLRYYTKLLFFGCYYLFSNNPWDLEKQSRGKQLKNKNYITYIMDDKGRRHLAVEQQRADIIRHYIYSKPDNVVINR